MPQEISLKGSYPVFINISKESSFVHWLNFAPEDMIEPFMIATMMRLNHTRPLHLVATGIDALQWLALRAFKSPSAVIFHTSRCGSTVLVNILKSVKDCVVISETPPLNMTAITPFGMNLWPGEERNNEHLRDQLIAGIISAYMKMPATSGFIKCNSLGSLLIPSMRRLYPAVPTIFSYRDPVEVVQANLLSPPPWVEALQNTALGDAIFGWSSDASKPLTSEEFLAKAYGRLCEMAAQNITSNMLLVNYNEINEALVPKLLRHLNITADRLDHKKMRKALSMYSKDLYQKKIFTDDSQEKRTGASDAVRQAVEQYGAAPYARLEILRSQALLP